MRTELLIVDLAPGGEGVARQAGRTVFVPFAAPGDRVVAEVPPGEGPAHATLVEVAAPGPSRQAPPCRHFGACGGCEWLHLAYPAQLAAKERAVGLALQRIGRLDPAALDLRPIVASPSALRYRTRAKFHLDRETGRLVFFQRRSHVAVQLAECHLLVPALDALREAVGPALTAARVPAREVALEWSEPEGRGAALLRVPELTAAVRARAEALLAAVPALSGAVLQAEEGAPAPQGAPRQSAASPRGSGLAVVGDPVLRQPRVPGDRAAGLQRSRPDVFQQANRGANALLVRTALALLRPEGEDLLELHCGSGNFTGPLAPRARSLAAVELQGPALELARADEAEREERMRGPGKVRFFSGDALKLALAFARERGPGARRFGAALLDPPREGAKGIGPALRALEVPRVVYVSCDPATLARDVRGCVDAGYRVSAVVPVDMFPQTHHVEAVVLMER